MPLYVHLVNYTQEGVEDIVEGPDRLEEIGNAAREFDGELRDVFLTLGRYDLVGVTEFPDQEAAAGFALTAASMGGSRSETLTAFSEDQFRDIVGGLRG